VWNLTPVERLYLFFIAAIIVSQMLRDSWDPVAVGLIGLFVGLIPAGRKDRERAQRRNGESDGDPVLDPKLTQESREAIRKYLRGRENG
jgi:hypothetical protein